MPQSLNVRATVDKYTIIYLSMCLSDKGQRLAMSYFFSSERDFISRVPKGKVVSIFVNLA